MMSERLVYECEYGYGYEYRYEYGLVAARFVDNLAHLFQVKKEIKNKHIFSVYSIYHKP